MKTSSLRVIVLLATISILGITITQVYWVRKAFDIVQDDFDRQVNAALLSVAQQFFKINNSPTPSTNPVTQVSSNYYTVTLNSDIQPQVLEYLLRTELESRNIMSEFEYGIYDCSQACMLYGNAVATGSKSKHVEFTNMPEIPNASYYFGVRFPDKEIQLANKMGIWTFSSVVLLIVIIFFGYALLVIFKQKRLSEIQKDFINNMTHEFRTPLSTIALSAEVLRQQAEQIQPERTRNYTTIIEQETKRMRQHLERMLQIARTDKADLQLKLTEQNIHLLIEETVNNLKPLFDEKQAQVNLQLQAIRFTCLADKHHLTNALFNLIDNALKYVNQLPVITVSTFNQDKHIIISIQDNGIGIEKDQQKRIFQKFYRVPTGNVHNVKGFGLGLSYVKQVVEAHKGKISVNSAKDLGSTFQIILSAL
ncbi:MAG: HAMP domain-containing sensor histidine kinase [Cyclobacteriaceae bacterium]|jgi:two-component system phosphate regulon sensor histidine kinase PhoR|nr:HAMP domain-containing histidine kinase [Flammeovirgaceae bacterium]MCZ8022966.1 HAMP domain-containing sensor histidine kinase [Cytophagales bacterium]MCZ8327342.1 HAMP domain-containing sensor histidine kinase [Cyclobacteriaceae bacterium]